MVLHAVVPGKAYYSIRFEDVPPEYILGGACLACAHKGPVNRFIIERRWSPAAMLRRVDPYLCCSSCGNGDHNRFIVFGMTIRGAGQGAAGGGAKTPASR